MSLSNRYDVGTKRSYRANHSIDVAKANRYGNSNTSDNKRSQRSRIESNPESDTSKDINPKIETIRKLGLLGGLQLKQIKYEGHIRIPTVHNDYHASTSNPGYSRKPDGGIYPK